MEVSSRNMGTPYNMAIKPYGIRKAPKGTDAIILEVVLMLKVL